MLTTFIPSVPQMFAEVDRDKVLKQGVELSAVYKTLQTFMGGAFVNYFNRFGRTGRCTCRPRGRRARRRRTSASSTCCNNKGEQVPLSALVDMQTTNGPEFIMHYNGYNAAQINASTRPGVSSGQVMAALEEVFAQTQPREMGYDYMGMSFQEQVAAQGVPPSVIFGFSLLMVFLILAAQYESWTLPFSVLLGVPIAVFGAFAGAVAARLRQQRLRADRSGDADRPGGQERHPHRRVRQGRVRGRQVGRRRGAGAARACGCVRS